MFFKEFEGNKKLETYFQIDGEYFKVINPERIEIKLSEKLG